MWPAADALDVGAGRKCRKASNIEPIPLDFRDHQEPYQQLNNRKFHPVKSGRMPADSASQDLTKIYCGV